MNKFWGCQLSAFVRAFAFAIPSLMSIALPGCATHSSAALFDVGAGASAELQALSRRAAAGDRRAQYELGLRFEEGRGVVLNRQRAMQLYVAAGRDEDGRLALYVPAARSGAKPNLYTYGSGRRAQGLVAARERLRQLQESGR